MSKEDKGLCKKCGTILAEEGCVTCDMLDVFCEKCAVGDCEYLANDFPEGCEYRVKEYQRMLAVALND